MAEPPAEIDDDFWAGPVPLVTTTAPARKSSLPRRTPLKRGTMKPSRRPPGVTQEIADAVLERDQHSCVVCGKNLHGIRGRDWSIHHRRPRRLGGDRRPETNLPANLISVCGTGVDGCHGWIESRRTEALEQGLILHANDKPEEHPISVWYGAVLLDNEGQLWPVGEAS